MASTGNVLEEKSILKPQHMLYMNFPCGLQESGDAGQ